MSVHVAGSGWPSRCAGSHGGVRVWESMETDPQAPPWRTVADWCLVSRVRRVEAPRRVPRPASRNLAGVLHALSTRIQARVGRRTTRRIQRGTAQEARHGTQLPSFPAFRWQAKAPASERPRLPDGTAWPTVKPLELMRWLVRLVTPPGGLVVDPFGGSGTTAEACIVEGFRCVLAEKDPIAAELIKARLAKPIQPDLFGGAA